MNNTKPSKVALVVLPILVLTIVGALIYVFLIRGKDLLKPNDQPEVKRLEGFPTIIYTEKILEKQRVVIKNDEELAQFLNVVDDSGALVVKDKINWDKEFLLGVSTKTYDSEGYEVKIKKLYSDKEKNQLLVSVREIEPGESCDLTMKKNVGVDLVSISKNDMEIKFERVKEIEECTAL